MILTDLAITAVANLGMNYLNEAKKDAPNGINAYFSKHDSLYGFYDQNSNLFKLDQLGLYFSDIALTEAGLQKVDDFFTRYGYAINDVVKPDPVARPYFTYIQTAEDCYTNKYGASGITQGSANAKQIAEINNILRNGVTFWTRQTTSDDIFKYDTLDNSPTT